MPENSPPEFRERQRRLGLLLAALCGVCWALLAIGLKVALGFASSGTIVWFRLASAFLFLLVFLGLRNRENLRILSAAPKLAIAASVGLAVNYYGFMKGLELTSPSNAQVFIQLAPLLLIVAGVAFFRERPSRAQIAGFAITFVGFAVFFKDQLDHAISHADRFAYGNAWIVLAAIVWVGFAVAQKILFRSWAPQQLNLFIYGLSSIFLAPLATWSEFVSLSPTQWLLMSSLGLNTVVAYGAFAAAMHKAPASEVSVVITLNPLLTLGLMELLAFLQVSWIVPDRVDSLGWLGAMIVVVGVILAVRRKSVPTGLTSR